MLNAYLLLVALATQGRIDPKAPDSVRLQDGRTMTGRVVYEARDALRIRRGKSELEIAREQIAEVQTLERSLAELLRQFETLKRDDVAALADLARFSASRGLTNEAHNLWLRVLLLDPANAEAIEGAGARRTKDATKVESNKRWIDLADYRAAKAKWKDAIELRTAHTSILSDLPLDDLLNTTMRVERHYQRFYGFLGPELGLYVFDETPQIRLYSNAKDYPPAWRSGSNSWFAPGENVLHVLVSGQTDMFRVFHDATDFLLFNAFRRSSGKTGQIPPWAVEGFSQYFAVTAGRTPEDPWLDLGVPSGALMRSVANDPEPLPVVPLLRSSHHEFRGGTDAERRAAEAYALVHYLLHADGGDHRPRFFELLRKAWSGKSIESDVLKSFGGDAGGLGAAVLAHARANAR